MLSLFLAAFQLDVVCSGPILGGTLKRFRTSLYYGKTAAPVTMPTPLQVINQFQATVEADWLAAISAQTNLIEYQCRNLLNPSNAVIFKTVGAVGGVAGDALSSIMAARMKYASPWRGKQYRSIRHVGLIPEANAAGNELTAPGLALFVTLGTDLGASIVEPVTGEILDPLIVSRKASNFLVPNSVYGVVADNVVTPEKTLGRVSKRLEKAVA